MERGVDDAGRAIVPVLGMSKRDVAAATDYSPAKIDRLVREGLPARRGRSNRAGLRFDLPVLIEWIAAHRAAEQGGGEDQSLAAAKRRKALADARKAELEAAFREGQLVEVDAVLDWIKKSFADYRNQLLSIPSQVTGLLPEQYEQLDFAINDMLADLSDKKASAWNAETNKDLEGSEF